MSLNYQGMGGAGQTVTAFDFDAFTSKHQGEDGLKEFYDSNDVDMVKGKTLMLALALLEQLKDQNYAAIRFSNPVMKKLVDFDWGAWQPKVQVMVEPNDAYVVFVLYREDIKTDGPMVPAGSE